MKKIRKRYSILLIILIAIGMTVFFMIFQGRKNTSIVDVYLDNGNQQHILTYGVNAAYIDGNNEKWKIATVTIDESADLNLEGIQLMYTVSDTLEQDLEEISKKYAGKKVWINMGLNQEMSLEDLRKVYERIESLIEEYENIYSVYDLDIALKLYKTHGFKWISHKVESNEDIEAIYNLPEELKGQVKVLINDYILENDKLSLSEQLDTISRLYYSIPMNIGQVKLIFNQGDLNKAHYKIIDLYNEIVSENWISTHKIAEDTTPYIKLQEGITVGNPGEFLVSYYEGIEFVEYKFNDQSVQKSYRFPFKLKEEVYDGKSGINKIKIIVKLKGQEVPYVQEYYLDFKDMAKVGERSERLTPDYPVAMQMTYEKPYIPVLMYHEFKDVVGESDSEQSISVSTKLFEEHIKTLLDNGYTPIHFKNLEDYFEQKGGLPEKPIILTTDDGYLSNYTIAYPILEKYNIPATYFITSAYVGIDTTMPHFTWEQAKEMEESGLVDIQSHTHGHALLDELSENEVRYQVSMSFARIEEELGKRDVKVLAYPQFQHNKKTVKWVEEVGINLQITNLAKLKGVTKPLDVKRIHVANTTSPEQLLEMIQKLTMK